LIPTNVQENAMSIVVRIAIAAWIVAAASAFNAQPASAGEGDIRTRTEFSKPGRAIDGDVRTRTEYTKPGRAIDRDIRTRTDYSKPGRAISPPVAKKKQIKDPAG
jgi:hypothetical protein